MYAIYGKITKYWGIDNNDDEKKSQDYRSIKNKNTRNYVKISNWKNHKVAHKSTNIKEIIEVKKRNLTAALYNSTRFHHQHW